MKRSTVILLMCTLLACASKIDRRSPVPEIPELKTLTSELYGVQIDVDSFVDARLPVLAENNNQLVTQPDGEELSLRIESALAEALKEQGVQLSEGFGPRIEGEIRRWDAVVSAAATGKLESNATLFISVKAPDGSEVYSGEYSGSRSSSFPVIAKQDVGESLGLAMQGAIEQLIRDPKLRSVLKNGSGGV